MKIFKDYSLNAKYKHTILYIFIIDAPNFNWGNNRNIIFNSLFENYTNQIEIDLRELIKMEKSSFSIYPIWIHIAYIIHHMKYTNQILEFKMKSDEIFNRIVYYFLIFFSQISNITITIWYLCQYCFIRAINDILGIDPIKILCEPFLSFITITFNELLLLDLIFKNHMNESYDKSMIGILNY
jgi:hypothetical protein